jgi:hypothetical protein
MECEALKPALAAPRLDTQLPGVGGEIEIGGHGPSVVADAVEEAPHVTNKQASRPGLVHEMHHARRFSVDVGKRSELRDADGSHPFSCRDR